MRIALFGKPGYPAAFPASKNVTSLTQSITMFDRRKFIRSSFFSGLPLSMGVLRFPPSSNDLANFPLVLSTWDAGLEANKAAWQVLQAGGRALDAVEKGVMVTEASQNCCVGLGANPDRDGFVTLDACIMDEQGNCGSVAFLERIKHPVSVARRIMEKTPHVMLVGSGAQQFAIEEGFPLEPQILSEEAKKAYEEWLRRSEYKPVINIENQRRKGPNAEDYPKAGPADHDTIGMIAIDRNGNLSGSCTTSGMGFKMRGRVGDSPIIGAGLFVDNEIGAATATGQGEDIIRIGGAHTVVELMRQGFAPEEACRSAVQRILKIKKDKANQIQIGFIAISKDGQYGGYALQKGFSYAVRSSTEEKLMQAAYMLQ